MPRAPRIPLSAVAEANACRNQYWACCRLWPDGIPVTRESLQIAKREGLNVDWAVHKLTTAKARNEYNRAKNKAYDKFQRADRAAWADRGEDVVAWQEYARKYATAKRAYVRIKDSLMLAALRETWEGVHDTIQIGTHPMYWRHLASRKGVK